MYTEPNFSRVLDAFWTFFLSKKTFCVDNGQFGPPSWNLEKIQNIDLLSRNFFAQYFKVFFI